VCRNRRDLYGVQDPTLIDPDTWFVDSALIARPGVANNEIFPEPVVRRILADLPDAEFHALDTGHFALEDRVSEIADLVRDFLARSLGLTGRGRK
jgi:hypothetical protein